jgi:hypothetical protein
MKLKLAIATLLLGVMPLAAHHSVTATFDTTKEITITGVVTRVEWLNPHTKFSIDVKNPDGTVSNWQVELAPPTALARTLPKDVVKVGDPITVVFWPAKDGSRLGNALDLILADRTLSFNPTRNITGGWEMRN